MSVDSGTLFRENWRQLRARASSPGAHAISIPSEGTHTDYEVDLFRLLDPTTGLFNGLFLQQLDLGDAVVLFLDLDHFKEVNSRYGHPTGTRILQEFALFLREMVRSDDLVVRYGGDEFIIVLKDCSPEQGRVVAERICEQTRERLWATRTPRVEPVKLTVSIGLTSLRELQKEFHAVSTTVAMLESAECALRLAKSFSRDCVCSG